MVSYHPAKLCDHRHCGSGDIMFLVAEEENSRYSLFNPPLLFNLPLLFISKGHGLKVKWFENGLKMTKNLISDPILGAQIFRKH